MMYTKDNNKDKGEKDVRDKSETDFQVDDNAG